jgi:transcriptional antiterminator Rof (Rho-off)
VEGFEYFVLKGATEILKNKNLKYIIIELNGSTLKFGHTNQEIFDLLVSYDFVAIRYDTKNRITRVMESFNEDKFNTIFVKKTVIND